MEPPFSGHTITLCVATFQYPYGHVQVALMIRMRKREADGYEMIPS